MDSERLRALAASMGYFVDSIDGLRQHGGQVSAQIFLRGHSRPGDGAEGYFLWDPASTAKDDGGTVINPAGGGDTGRWVRMTRGAAVTPLWWGAKFDDMADDTDAIQASIDFAMATGGAVLLPPGTAKITRTLTLGTNGHGVHSGLRFAGRGKFGDSGSSMRDGSGTLLKYYGAAKSAEAIVMIDRSVWRYTTVGDLSLLAVTPMAARFGMLFDSTEFSQHRVENVTVGNVEIGYGIVRGSGGNGEFTYFSNCDAGQVAAFFYNNSGQAFNQRFEHCSCGLLPGGTYFVLDIAAGVSPGGGLIVTDFNATGGGAGDPHPPTNTTLLHAGESMAPVSFFGGRIEHLTRLVDLAPNYLGLTLSFQNMDITVDCDPALPHDRIGAFITVRDNPAVITIGNCAFAGTHGREVLGIDVTDCPNYGPAITFAHCIFGSFIASPKVIGSRLDRTTAIKFVDCRASTSFSHPLRDGKLTDDRRRPLDFEWGAGETGMAPRSANLLISPSLRAFDGATGPFAAPDAPWAQIGAPGGVRIARADLVDGALRDHSPWARIVLIQPGAGLYQDIGGIDLAADAGATSQFGLPVHELFYRALFPIISGAGSLRIALENSVTGETYDESVLISATDQTSGPHLMALTARVPPTAQSSALRFKLHNIATSGVVGMKLAWQVAARRPDAAFVGIAGVAELTEDWALSTASLRAWDRFMLPYKPDAFGSAAPSPLNDLYSEQYVSADDGRLTYYAADGWFKAPRTIYAAGPPQHGSWRVGDQALTDQPKAGGYVGWICTAAGSPGEWRPFGLIA